MGNDENQKKSRDAWDKAEIFSKIIGAIGIPLLLWWLGISYNNRQRTVETTRIAAESSANRLTTLLKSLSSDSLRERLIATKVADYLARKNQLPPELVPALLEISMNDPDQKVSHEAVKSLAAAGIADKTLAPAIQKSLQELPSRVYVHIRDNTQRDKARKLSLLLEQSGFIVPGIERVAVGPDNTEVKYFFDKQAQDAQKIAGIVSPEISGKVETRLNSGYQGKVNARQFELWLAATAR